MLLAIGAVLSVSAQEHYYYYKGEKIYLDFNPSYIFVSGFEKSSIENISLNATIDTENSTEIITDFTGKQNARQNGQYPIRYYKRIKLLENLSITEYLELIEQIEIDNNDLIIAPYFKNEFEDNELEDKFSLTNYLIVKLKKENDYNLLLAQIEINDLELIGNNDLMPLWYTISVKPGSKSALQMANSLYEKNIFKFVEPVFSLDHTLSLPTTVDDVFYGDQWYLKNTGQNGGTEGIDIKIEKAWEITEGNGVKVAVIDQGIEMDHPDLKNNILPISYDAEVSIGINVLPSVIRGNHGTACAGIIAAEGNNNEGIIGVAPQSKLISISSQLAFTTNSSMGLARGICWAADNGADVISCSWYSGVKSEALDQAINNAINEGRNGYGTVVVFSSGNNSIHGVSYPANSNEDILCVGGVDRCGIRSGRESHAPDACELWPRKAAPGSSFGASLDVVAAGTGVSTTDLKGENGYNKDGTGNYSNLDYTKGFGGTSAACPMVAGVVALVLSVNPNLTVTQVNDIIEQSAQKVRKDKYTYQTTANRPNGAWNNELGYGFVNAHAAVVLAQQSLVCEDDIIVEENANNEEALQYLYTSSNKISTEETTSLNADVIISEGGDVDFKSEHIQLNPGFKVDDGACFNALIDPCEN